MKLSSLPKIRFANLPTPLQELSNLTKALRGPKIFVKRDDMTGLALGGNKTRKLEYIMADALKNNADYIVTGAGFQSNWCTQATAAACVLGMRTVLIKKGPDDGYLPPEYDGNHLLQEFMGAEIRVVKPEHDEEVKQETLEQLRAAGHHPYLIQAAGSTPPGVVGYLNAMLELAKQTKEIGIHPDYVVQATGSGGTQAGLVLGAKMLNTKIKILAATTGSRNKQEQTDVVSQLIEETLRWLNLNIRVVPEDLLIFDQYGGGGYGFINKDKVEAIKLVAESEGMFIDPVYTGSAMACLIDLIRQGFFHKDETVVFLHSGGQAALFPYKEPLSAYLLGKGLAWRVPPWSPIQI